MNRPLLLLPLLCLAIAACGDDVGGGDPAPVPVDPDSLLANPLDELPELLSELGLYPSAPDLDVVPETAVLYAPANPLWSSGSDKQRFIVLPEGESVDNSGELWDFPVGTLLFKTFTFWDAAGVQRPYETRLMRRLPDDDGEEDWDLVTYVWNEEGTDATLSDMRRPIPVEVFTEDGTALTHNVPSLLQCRKCHESNRTRTLGFSEVQLSDVDETGESPLERFYLDGLLAHEPPTDPARVTHEDPLTEEFLRYVTGNCTHCHNGSDGPSSSYDLRYDVALDNLINQSTQSSVSAVGTRVIPGNPAESILYEAFSRDTDEQDIEFMPPVGIDLVDAAAVDLIRDWIASLPSE